ncbi:MAG TPA: nickel pincer cofactor biosynthesis protein LarC [Myxococcota bacterium]|nr:nickel pincer cofactor biosynthesis protein LarC [Myxococcota bacterium]
MASERRTSPRSSTAPERGRRGAGARLLHFDCFSGAAGNMLLGALLEVGADARAVRAAHAGLGVGPIRMRLTRVPRGALDARYVAIQGRKRDSAERTWKSIRALLRRARLSPRVRAQSLEVFERVARAEARIHGVPIESIHFHEIGALDALGDVVGVCAAVESLGVARVTCSPLPLGRGEAATAHGAIPLPAPATVELLRGIPTFPYDVEWETVTPTGAALLATLVHEFAWLPALRPSAQGFGAGDDRRGPLPNALRAVLGEAEAELARDEVAVLDTHLDDMTPEHLAFLVERLHAEGALDASLTPLLMKKGRPGQALRVLARPSDAERLARLVLSDSSALGVRVQRVPRLLRKRAASSVATKYGPIRVKLSRAPDGAQSVKPEYEACARAARRHGVAIATVARAAQRSAEDQLG